jgi:hypothetical protein
MIATTNDRAADASSTTKVHCQSKAIARSQLSIFICSQLTSLMCLHEGHNNESSRQHNNTSATAAAVGLKAVQ